MESGHGRLCASTVDAVHQEVFYLVAFEDESRPNFVLTDKEIGIKGVAKLCAEGQPCFLLQQMEREDTGPSKLPEGQELYILRFEDVQKADRRIYDRTEARITFAKAEMMGWNCHLFERAL